MDSHPSGTNQNGGVVKCYCGLPAKVKKAWTDKNPARRFYGCEKYERGDECNYFRWYDEEEPSGWQKKALIEARNEIREKNKIIVEQNKKIAELKEDMEKKDKEEESLINSFLRL